MGDLEGKIKVRVLLAQAFIWESRFAYHGWAYQWFDFETIAWLENF
jgi:hypothetical protein